MEHSRKRTIISIVILSLLCTVVTVSADWEPGQFWSRNTNTLVLTNSSHHVRIGLNQTTDYNLTVDGRTQLNGTVNVTGETTFHDSVDFLSPVEFQDDAWFYDKVTFTGDINFIGQYINLTTGVDIYIGNVKVGLVPLGSIQMWAGSTVPYGWSLCDGTGGTPDLRGKFIVAADPTNATGNGTYALNQTGGEARHRLTVPEIPAHTHTYNAFGAGTVLIIGAGTRGQVSANTGSTGGGGYHENRPQYYALAYIQFTGYADIP
jgi:hypothetical protein